MRRIAKPVFTIVLLALCVVLIYLSASPVVIFAEQSASASTEEIQTFVQTLCAFNGANDKEGARNFIVQSFKDVLGEDDRATSDSKVKLQRAGIDGYNYYNVEAR